MRVWTAAAVLVAMFVCGPAVADIVELVSGEKLEGEIIGNSNGDIVMQHAVLGRIEIPASQIKPPDEGTPGMFGTDFLKGWHRQASAGWSQSTGKSKNTNFNADLLLGFETERNRGAFDAGYYFSEGEEEVNNNEFDTRYTHDFLFPELPVFLFLSPFYRFDSQQDWTHRAGIDGGLGYQFLKTDEWDVLGRLGVGVARTFDDDREETTSAPGSPGNPSKRGDNPIRTEVNGLAGLDATWHYMKGQSLYAGAEYQPDFNDLPEFRAVGKAEWRVAVGAVAGLGFKLGINYIHDSHESGSNRNDRKYYANLTYDF